MKNRDAGLDIMRFLGIIVIMVAHSDPPEWLFQLRNFEVPLLVVTSALTAALGNKKKGIAPLTFYKKRILKLTIPAWLFLSLYFILIFLYTRIQGVSYIYGAKTILSSYLFSGGIGYVWILKIYIILMLLTPFSLELSENSWSNKKYYTFILLLYIGYEMITFLCKLQLTGMYLSIVINTIIQPIAYGLIFLYGLRLKKLTISQIISISMAAFAIFIVIAVYKYDSTGQFDGTQSSKYPPTVYYLSYAIFCLNLVYLICTKWLVKIVPVNLSTWLSANSLWVYLWHILAIFIWKECLVSDGSLLMSIIRFTFILSFGIMMTLLQNTIVKKFLVDRKNNLAKKLVPILSGNYS